jgi:FtsZ-binding cell division protein ZapB
MTPWLALSLGLWLGQTPEVTPSLPPDADTQDPAALEFRSAWERALLNADATDEGQDYTDGTVQMPVLDVGGSGQATRSVPVTGGTASQPAAGTAATGTGGAGTAGAPDDAPAQDTPPDTGSAAGATGPLQLQVDELRTQVQTLQSQVAVQQQQDAVMRERAETLEEQRQQRLSELERAGQWLVAADQALLVGELDIGDALREADSALLQVVQSATEAGSGQTVLLVEDARSSIAHALSSTGNRDTYRARWDLLFAAERLREARRHNLDEASATTVTR